MDIIVSINWFGGLWDNIFGPGSTWFWVMLQAIAVTVTLSLIYKQIKTQRQTNALAALQRLDERWNSKDLKAARFHVCENHGNNAENITYKEEAVLNFLEEMGLHFKKRVFDIESAWEMYSYYIEHYWPILKPKIDKFREDSEDLTWYINSEAIYDAVVKYCKKRKAPHNIKTEEEINKFIRGELEFTNSMNEEAAVEDKPPAAEEAE